MLKLPVVTLQRNLARSIRKGHPWIYRESVNAPVELASGDLVLIADRDGTRIAVGYWDAESAIAVRVLAPTPCPDPRGLVEQRLSTALALRLSRLDLSVTNAFRWIHGEGDGLPGVHIDLYGSVAAIRYDGDGARAFFGKDLPGRLQALAALQGLALTGSVDRETKKITGVLPNNPEVIENHLRFKVDLLTGQKGGLFLDQRENRAAVAAQAKGKSVLNLFGYTGAFSVYAAHAGAQRTDTVDLAAPAIAAARENFIRNSLDTGDGSAGFFATDAFAFLQEAAAHGKIWDIVISDPPSFAPRASAVEQARGAYRRLHRLAAAVTSPGGLFCPASCSSHFPEPEFMASVYDGLFSAGRAHQLLCIRGAGFDHPVLPAFPEGAYLKFAMLRLS